MKNIDDFENADEFMRFITDESNYNIGEDELKALVEKELTESQSFDEFMKSVCDDLEL
jgi:hypothetical protein